MKTSYYAIMLDETIEEAISSHQDGGYEDLNEAIADIAKMSPEESFIVIDNNNKVVHIHQSKF